MNRAISLKAGRLSLLLAFVIVLSLGATAALAGQSPAAIPTFQSPPPVPPANDNFANATVISALPFTDSVDNTLATTESGEPQACNYSSNTIWYTFTSSQATWLHVDMSGSQQETNLVVYRADAPGFEGLGFISCSSWGPVIEFLAQAGATYYFQADSISGPGTLQINVREFLPPPPAVDFSFWPYDPSTFDTVGFNSYCWDPAGAAIDKQSWDLGDGTTAEGCCPSHRYAADADYTVTLTCTTPDGRSGTSTKTIAVGTHDVAITKLVAPTAARVGQTRSIAVQVKNSRYPERVHIELYKSVPGGFQWVTSTEQNIPVRSGGRTTSVGMSYTFAKDDAELGKVTFRAVATLGGARDALPADNEAISAPTKVSGK